MVLEQYSIEQIDLWAEEYKKTLSIRLVAKRFGADTGTIKKWFRDHKDELNVETVDDIRKRLEGTNEIYCGRCNTIKLRAESVELKRKSGRIDIICKTCARPEGPKLKARKEAEILFAEGKKRCIGKNGCNRIKLLPEFGDDKRHAIHGKQTICLSCAKKYVQSRPSGPITTKCTIDEARPWAERYKALLSFRAVAKEFDINFTIVWAALTVYKEELGLKFKDDLRTMEDIAKMGRRI